MAATPANDSLYNEFARVVRTTPVGGVVGAGARSVPVKAAPTLPGTVATTARVVGSAAEGAGPGIEAAAENETPVSSLYRQRL